MLLIIKNEFVANVRIITIKAKKPLRAFTLLKYIIIEIDQIFHYQRIICITYRTSSKEYLIVKVIIKVFFK